MTTFVVTNKASGQEVYRYSADTAIEWTGMDFADFDHTAEVELITDVVPRMASDRILTKLEYLRRFTQAERIAIRAAAKAVAELDDYLELLALAQDVRLDDPDIVAALNMLESGGLIGDGRAQEILNGN